MSERRLYSTKIPGRSIPEVSGRFEVEVARQAGVNGLRFGDKKMTAEAMTNAIVMHFLSLDEHERDRIAAVFVPRFEAIMAGEAAPARDVVSHEVHPATSVKKKRGQA